MTKLVQHVAQGGHQGVRADVLLHDAPFLVQDGAARLDEIQPSPPRNSRLEAPGQYGTLGTVALGDALEWIAVVTVVVRRPVETACDLLLAQLAVSYVFRDIPHHDRAWFTRSSEFL